MLKMKKLLIFALLLSISVLPVMAKDAVVSSEKIEKFKSLVVAKRYKEALKMLENLRSIKEFFAYNESILQVKKDKWFSDALTKKFSATKAKEAEEIISKLPMGNNLDELNSRHDGFENRLDRGTIYNYSGSTDYFYFFEVIQVVDQRRILVARRLMNESMLEWARPVVLSVLHKKGTEYYPGQRLESGKYVCWGTITYQTVDGRKNTIYHLLDMESFKDVAPFAVNYYWADKEKKE